MRAKHQSPILLNTQMLTASSSLIYLLMMVMVVIGKDKVEREHSKFYFLLVLGSFYFN